MWTDDGVGMCRDERLWRSRNVEVCRRSVEDFGAGRTGNADAGGYGIADVGGVARRAENVARGGLSRRWGLVEKETLAIGE